MESRGFTFEAADASFELLLREEIAGKRADFFTIEDWQTTVDGDAHGGVTSKATVTLTAHGESIVTTEPEMVPLTRLIPRFVRAFRSSTQS